MICVQGLSFDYGSRRVLRDVNFALEPGKLTCVLGKNGAGKSTLFRCILGLLRGYRGSITLDGKEVRSLSPRQIARQVAYIPQIHYSAFNYSVLDMVLMGTAHQHPVYAGPGKEQMEQAEEALRQVGIRHLRERGYTQLSGGEQQLVLLARALAQQAPVLVLDEPTANLDYGNQLQTMKQAQQLARQGYTVLLSSHSPQHALTFAHHVIALQDGAVLGQGQPQQVLSAEFLEELYHVKVSFVKAKAQNLIVPE